MSPGPRFRQASGWKGNSPGACSLSSSSGCHRARIPCPQPRPGSSPLWRLVQRGSAARLSSSRSAVLCGGNSSCSRARSPVYRAFCSAMSGHSSGGGPGRSWAAWDQAPQNWRAGAEGGHPRRRPRWGGELLLPGMATFRQEQDPGLCCWQLGRVGSGLKPGSGPGGLGEWEGQGAHRGHAINSPSIGHK